MKKKKTGLIILTILCVATFFSTVQTFSSNSGAKSALKKNGIFSNPFASFFAEDYIAELHIDGVIQEKNKKYDQEWLLNTIEDLKNDDENVGIALFIDSPGGGVYESDEVYLALKKYKEDTGRPIYAYQQSLAASGAYYISMAADKIYANRNTLTGSIGVITGTSMDCTELLEKIGIKSKTITAGKNKNMFNFNEPLTEEHKTIMQKIADECYEQFTQIIAENRTSLTLEEIKNLADGRIYTAKQAKENKLIDEISSKEDFYTQFKSEKFDGNDYRIERFKYNYDPSIGELLFDSITGKTNLELLPNLIQTSNVSYPAYLYTGF